MEEHLESRPKKEIFPLEKQEVLRAKAIEKFKEKFLPDDKIIKVIMIGGSVKGKFGKYEEPGFRGSIYSDFDFIVFVEEDYEIPDWLEREPKGKPFWDHPELNLSYKSRKFVEDKYNIEVFFVRKSTMENIDFQKLGESAGIPMIENSKIIHIEVYKK